jgi:hypothetical protein
MNQTYGINGPDPQAVVANSNGSFISSRSFVEDLLEAYVSVLGEGATGDAMPFF